MPRNQVAEDSLLLGSTSRPAHSLAGEALERSEKFGACSGQVVALLEPRRCPRRWKNVRVALVLLEPIGRAQQHRQRLAEEIHHRGHASKGAANSQDILQVGGQGEQALEEEPEKNSTQPGVLHVRQRPFRPTNAEGSAERGAATADALFLSRFRRPLPIERERERAISRFDRFHLGHPIRLSLSFYSLIILVIAVDPAFRLRDRLENNRNGPSTLGPFSASGSVLIRERSA